MVVTQISLMHHCLRAHQHFRFAENDFSIRGLSALHVVAPLGVVDPEGGAGWRTSSPTGPVSDPEAAP